MGKSIRVAKGKEVFEIDAQDLPFAAKDGFLPTERIIVANSKTKESFEIDPADYLNAVNDGFEFADLAKKKEPIQSNLPPSPVPSPSPSDANIEQPVTIQQIRELKVLKFEQVIGGSMVAPSQPIQKDNPELKPAIEKYAAQYGLTDRDVETIVEDFDWADDSFVRNLGVMKQRSPEEFYRTIDAYYVRQSLPKEKQAQFNNLQSYGDLQGLQNNMQILWKDLQGNREAQERLLRMNQPYINPSNLDVRVAAQKFNSENRDKIGRDLSRYEYAGLKTLEVFNPELAQSYINELRTGSEWAGAKKTERNAQLERIALQLETIGRENTIRAAKQTNEVISFYKKQMDAAATPEEKQSVAEMMQADPIVKAAPKIAEELEELQLAESFDDKAYPTLRAIDAVQVYNQTRRKGMSALDVAVSMPVGFVSGLGKYAEGTLNTIDNVIGAVVLGDEDILRRDMLKRGEMTIGTADDKRYGQQSLFSVDANFSKQIESVLADESLTPDEKKAKTIDLIYKNPDKYKLNPNADKFDLNAQTVLLGGSELMGEILGLALLQRGMGAGVNAPKYKNLAATLGSTGVAMYDDFYKQALIRNSESPALEASLDVAIAWLSEMISPDYKIVRKVLGKSNSPVIAGITEETWNAIRSRLPQAAVATIRGLSKAISTAIPESLEEMSGAAMTQAKERGVFGRETAKPDATNAEKAVFGEGINPFIDDVVNAGVTTLATMAVPSTVSLISNAKGVSFEDKSRLYALGVRGEAGLPADMPEKIRKVVTEMQAIVANIKDNYPELNEKQRTEMAFNMYRKKAIQADKATMTEKQKEQADKAIIEADDAIEATVVGEKAVIEQIDGDAKVETDAIDKKIESLNPESEGYKEKKAELKEEKATIKQTAEERKAALKEAVRAAFPQTPTNEPTTTEANQPTAEIEGATNPQQIEAGTPTGVQPSIGDVGQGRTAGNVAVEGNEALRDVESTAKALGNVGGSEFNAAAKKATDTLDWAAKDLVGNRSEMTNEKEYVDRALKDGRYANLFPTKQGQIAYAKSMWKAELTNREFESKKLSEAYHKAKADGSNPELVKAVEDLLGGSQRPSQPIPQADTESQIRNFIQQSITQFPDVTSKEIMEAISEDAPQLVATEEQQQAVADLINQTIAENAVQEQSAAGVDVRQQAEDGEGMGEGNAEVPPTPPTDEQVGSDEEGPKLRDKGILNRLYNAERIPQQAREAFKDNLKYEPKSQVEAEKIAQGIIAEFGIDEAVLRAEAGTFHGDVNSMIFATALNQLYEQESKAQGDDKVAIAKKFADISMRYDEAARSGGRFISAIGYFYKKSPLGMRMLEEANRNEQFKEWIKSKENDYRAFFEELMKEPEVQEMVEKEVRERLKKERAQKRTERKKKVNDAIDKWINDLGKQTYSSVVPPTVLIPVLKAAKGLYNAGESVLEIVEKAVDSIDEKMNGADWDRDAFRTKLSGMLDEAESADELKRQRAIEKFRNKLKGLSEEQKDKLIRKSLRKLVADGALEFDDFKKMLADIIGMGEMSPEEIAAFEQTVKDMNAAADVADEIANAETLTPEMMQRYNEARVKAEKAAIAYGDLVYNKPDITKRLLSYLQLAPLGIKALVTNPFYNVWQHVAVRIPTAVVGNVVDTILYRASQVGNSIWGTDVLYPKNDPRNIAEVQKQFFKGGFFGTKKAMSQVVTGLTDKDYIQKDMYNSRNKPLVAIRDIFNQLTKKKLMTNKQIFDKMLQGTLGITMEGVARLLNVGDKPMRYAAERAEAARFAKELGLKDLELDFFMELPREIAFREYKKRGMTDEAAGEKADEIVDGIIKSGEKSVFQGDNILANAIDAAFEKAGIVGRFLRVLNMPYVKTPLNSLWSLYNLVNPYLALAQVTFYGGRAVANKSRKDYEESKYWLGHAVSGFALHALMGTLVQYGIFSPPDEDDESKREREGRKTYNPNGTVNVTKLWAFFTGQDPNAVKNGIVVDMNYWGVVGTMGAMITKKNQEMTEEQRQKGMTFMEDQMANFNIAAKHFIDKGVFQQTSVAIDAFQNKGAALDQWLMGMINMGTNVIQPAMFAQISRAQLPYYSRQKADDFKGQVKNSMLSRSSLLRDLTGEMPPSKIGVWGDTMSKGGSEFWDVMGRLFGITRENDDNFAQPIYEDYMKYNDPLFFPPALKPELDGKKLTAQQYDDLQIFVGQQRKELAKPYVNNGATIPFINKKYSELSKEQKLKALEYIYEVGKENGIVLFTQKYKDFQKPFEAPTYESIMEKINNKYMQSFKQMLPKIRN